MSQTSTETTTIEQTVRIEASRRTVWALWTDPTRLTEWWGSEADVVAEPGGRYRVVMENGPTMLGEIIELDEPNRLVFTFGWEQNAPGELLAPGSTRVEVTLVDDGGTTVLTLRHSDMPVTHAADHSKGWDLYVGERLVDAATGGGSRAE